jgi:DNA-binding XRE family transcriptional regulator
MKIRDDYQVINDLSGRPEYILIPYEEYKSATLSYLKKTTVPHEVVCVMVESDISLIRAWREYLGFTQQEVAERLGITQAALSQIEDKNGKPRKATLQKLAAVFDLTVEQLR